MAAPVTEAELPAIVQHLQSILQNVSQRENEAALLEMEKRPQFAAALLHVVANQALATSVRTLAATTMREAINRRWRARAAKWGGDATTTVIIGPEEQEQIKAGLLELLQNPSLTNTPLIRQVSMVLARVAHLDDIKHWPALLPAIHAGLVSPDNVTRFRYLVALHFLLLQLLKSSKVGAGGERYREFCNEVIPMCQEMADSYSSKLLEALRDGNAVEGLPELCAYSHKVMLRVLRGCNLMSPPAQAYVPRTVEFLKACVAARKGAASMQQHQTCEILDVAMKKAMKALEKSLQYLSKPFCDAGLLLPALSFSVEVVFTSEPYVNQLSEPFFLQALEIIHHVIQSMEGLPSAKMAVEQLFNVENLNKFVEVLLNRYLCLHAHEVELWETDPEAFVFEQQSEMEAVNVKSMAEQVFMQLVGDETLAPAFLPLLTQYINSTLSNASSPDAQRENVFHAMGLGCWTLPNAIDEGMQREWLNCALSGCSSSNKFVQRRAIWVLGQWVYNVPEDMRGTVYQTLVAMQATSTEMVHRLTALHAMQQYIDDENFDVAALVPVLDRFLGSLLSILFESSNNDLKEAILPLVGLLVIRVGATHFAPFSGQLMQTLVKHWQAEVENPTEGNTRVMERIIECLTNVMQVLGCQGDVHSYVCKIVQYVTNIDCPYYVELLESGLELWLNTIRNSAAMSPDLLECYRNMPALLSRDFETFETALKIVNEYLLMRSDAWSQQYGGDLFESLLSVLRSRAKRDEGLLLVIEIIDEFLIAMPGAAMAAAPLFDHMLDSIAANSEGTAVLVSYLAVLCRLLLVSPSVAQSIFERKGAVELVRAQLADVIINNFDSVADVIQRKLCLMALTSMFQPPHEAILGKLDEIAACAVEIILLEENDEEGTFREFTSNAATGTRGGEDCETLSAQRRKELLQTDPLSTVKARAWFMQHLEGLRQTVGDDSFKALLQTIGEHNRVPLGI